MAVVADRVIVELEAANDKYIAEVRQTERAFDRSMDGMTRSAGQMESRTSGSLTAVTGGLKGLAGGLLAGASAGAIFAAVAGQVRSALNFGDELQASADKLGVTAEKLQQLQFAADETDVPLTSLQSNLERLNATVGAFKTGVGDDRVKEAFQAMRISPADLRGIKTGSDLLPILADRLGRVGTVAEQVQIAKKLGIDDLLPLLRQGSEGMAELEQSASDLGYVLSNETVKGLADAHREMEKADKLIKANLTVAFSGLATGVADVTSELAGFIAKMREIETKGPRWQQVIQDFLVTAGNPSAMAGREAARRLAPQGTDAASNKIPSAAETRAYLGQGEAGASFASLPGKPARRGAAGRKDDPFAASNAFAQLQTQINDILFQEQEAREEFGKALEEFGKLQRNKRAGAAMDEFFKRGDQGMNAEVFWAEDEKRQQELADRVQENLYDATYDGVHGALTALANGDIAQFFAQSIGEALLKEASDALTQAILNSGGTGNLLASAGKAALSLIPGFATGTPYAQGGLARVHKDELVHLPRGASVIPRSQSQAMLNQAGGGGGPIQVSINLEGANGDETIRAISAQAAAQGVRQALQLSRQGAPGLQARLNLLGTP